MLKIKINRGEEDFGLVTVDNKDNINYVSKYPEFNNFISQFKDEFHASNLEFGRELPEILFGYINANIESDSDNNLRKDNSENENIGLATKLVRDTIQSVNKNIVGLPSVDAFDGKEILGRFRASNRLYVYKINQNNNFAYKEIKASELKQDSLYEFQQVLDARWDDDVDKDGQDNCKVGNPCSGECIPRSSECKIDLPEEFKVKAEKAKDILSRASKYSESASESDKLAAKMIYQTFETGELPTKKEAASLGFTAAKELIKNPKTAISRGMEREALMREAMQLATDADLSRSGFTKQAVKNARESIAHVARKDADKLKEEGAMSIGGMIIPEAGKAIGTIAGTTVAGPAGGLVGAYIGEKAADLTGSLIVRNAMKHYKAHKKAAAALDQDAAYQAADRLTKKRMKKAQKLSELEKMNEEIRDNKIEDVSGWAIGNGSDAALQAVGVNIPYQGMFVAMGTGEDIKEGYKRIRNGENIKQVVKETITAPVRRVKETLNKGNQREERLRQTTRENIRRIKNLGLSS